MYNQVSNFPTVERLIRLFGWMTIFGAVLLAIALLLGLAFKEWLAASILLAPGVLAVATGLWARRRGRRLMENVRRSRD